MGKRLQVNQTMSRLWIVMKGMAREEAPDSHPLLPQLVAIMNSFSFNGEF